MAQTVDFQDAKRFIASVPPGRWTSYGDVAKAAGAPKGAQAIGMWCSREGDTIPGVHRVLNANGEVSAGWRPAGPELPPDRRRVYELLEDEGIDFDDRGRASVHQRWAG